MGHAVEHVLAHMGSGWNGKPAIAEASWPEIDPPIEVFMSDYSTAIARPDRLLFSFELVSYCGMPYLG